MKATNSMFPFFLATIPGLKKCSNHALPKARKKGHVQPWLEGPGDSTSDVTTVGSRMRVDRGCVDDWDSPLKVALCGIRQIAQVNGNALTKETKTCKYNDKH